MPAPEPPALEGAKDYRERYQELIGPSLGECPASRRDADLKILCSIPLTEYFSFPELTRYGRQ